MKNDIDVPELAKVSSKGQVVIPARIREKAKIKEGTTLAVSSQKNIVIMRKLDEGMTEDDLRTLKDLEKAWKDIEEGRFKELSIDEFFKELKKW